MGYGKQFNFQYDLSDSNVALWTSLSNASEISQVWDVTDLYNVTKLENPDQTSFSFKANLGELRKYVFGCKSYFVPIQDSKPKVPNQNLKGTVFKNNQGKFQDVDYVIVTPFS
jgi:hypothetical protein